jgi:uncharacterized membrane protein
LSSACGSAPGVGSPSTSDSSSTATTAPSCPSTSTLTYESFGKALISDHCLACHAGAERPTLTSQASVKANASAIIDQAVTTTRMPQSGGLTAADRSKLGEWLSCGAP